MSDTITLYQWILQEFTVENRADLVSDLKPHLAKLIQRADPVLDLCCGAGPFAFALEEFGAKVTAIDFAPYMIELAQQEAFKRGSTVNFVLGDVLTHDLGIDQFELVVFLGNTISDFSLSHFVQLSTRVNRALRQHGRFVIHYVDGLYPFISGEYPREAVQQEQPDRIVWHFKEYLSEQGVYIETYTNETTGELYEYTSYVYNPPMVRLIMDGFFDLEQSIPLSEKGFLDTFRKRKPTR